MNDSAENPPQSPTTRWSLVVAAADGGENPADARRALEELCQIYWWPVLQFILRRGYPLHDAQDLTQDFFLRLSVTDFLKHAHPEKGRFRALVFASLKHLLLDAADRLNTLKRGGGQKLAQLEEWMEEEIAKGEISKRGMAPEEYCFDRDWAALVVRKALERLREEFSLRGKAREFGIIRPFLTGGEKVTAYTEAASTLRLPVGTVKAIVHRSRVRYGTLLRDEVTQTIADLRDLDDEIRHLCQILAAQPVTAGSAVR